MKIRKLTALLLAFLLPAGLMTACGETAPVSAETAAVTTAEPTAEPTEEPTEEPSADPTATAKPTVERTQDIRILFTNDVHCHLSDNLGYAAVATLKKQYTDEGDAVILVDAGDALQGAPEGSLSHGSIPIEIMNELGYSAMAVGNHDFDYGVDTLLKRAQGADFPFLSVNFRSTATGEALFDPYTLVEADGLTIAFVGITTPETLTSSTPTIFQDSKGNFIYDLMSDGSDTGATLWAAVQEAVDSARAEGADYVIALSHLGVIAASKPYTSNDLIENTTGIDAVFDGHSHTYVNAEMVKNADGEEVPLSQCDWALKYIGVLTLDTEGKISVELLDQVEQDADFTAYVDESTASIKAILSEPVIETTEKLTIYDPETGTRLVRNAETNLGDLCADAVRHAANADIGIVNGGGVRDDLPLGTVTYGDVRTVHPFNNVISVIRCTGQEVMDMLEFSVKDAPEEFGGFLQVSGLTFTYDPTVPSPAQVDKDGMFTGFADGERRVKEVLVNGEPLDPEATYTVAGLNYILRNSGNGYSFLADCPAIVEVLAVDFDVLADYLRDVYPSIADQYSDPYGQGRITAVN